MINQENAPQPYLQAIHNSQLRIPVLDNSSSFQVDKKPDQDTLNEEAFRTGVAVSACDPSTCQAGGSGTKGQSGLLRS